MITIERLQATAEELKRRAAIEIGRLSYRTGAAAAAEDATFELRT